MDEYKKVILMKDLDRFDYYIEKADNKANFILALAGALLVAVAFQSNSIVGSIKIILLKKSVIYLLLIIAIFLFITCIFALLVIIPRTPKGSYNSKFYFEDLKDMDESSLINSINNTNESAVMEDISKQVIILANDCSKKMSNVRNSLICLAISGILIIINIFLILICV